MRSALAVKGYRLGVLAAALGITVSGMIALERGARHNVVEAHLWFDSVSYDLRWRAAEIGGPLTRVESERVRSLAFDELQHAYKDLRIALRQSAGGTYRVRVVQEFPSRLWEAANPIGEARPLGPLGGEAAVNFFAIASSAIHYAPPGTGRAAIVDGIGRGLGRTAAHELAHLLLFGRQAAASDDRLSYEFESASRVEHYFGTLRWDTAWPRLVERLGAK